MLGIAVQLLLSWLLAWLFEKKNLRILGLWPTRKRLRHFLLFFVFTAACCAAGYLLKMLFFGQQWMVNPQLTGPLILSGMWWNVKSVLFEELIFRGVPLYILIRKFGGTKAILVSAVAFGIYHWFSFNVFGNVMNMTFLFLLTGIFGWVLAYAYFKTGSLYVPVAVHLGWNATQQVLFSDSTMGRFILIPVAPRAEVMVSYVTLFAVQVLPLILTPLLNYLLLRRLEKQAYWEREKPGGNIVRDT